MKSRNNSLIFGIQICASPFLQLRNILKQIFLELIEIIWFLWLSLNPVLYYLLNREKDYSFI